VLAAAGILILQVDGLDGDESRRLALEELKKALLNYRTGGSLRDGERPLARRNRRPIRIRKQLEGGVYCLLEEREASSTVRERRLILKLEFTGFEEFL